jgi:NAD(P)-dependent dehydrogenase (short-subunit alcohol dehydrogenase family)
MTATISTDAALVVGASGGIGAAVLQQLLESGQFARVVAVSRADRPDNLAQHWDRLWWIHSDYSETSIAAAIEAIASADWELRRVVICNGILHQSQLQPEKALEKVHAASMSQVFEANTIVPSLWVSALVKPLRRSTGCFIVVLSARVGSIADNRLGGWYSYRASKAALNMFMKTAAVEFARRAPAVKLVAFHPGTTDTELSKPFQKGVPPGRLFTPDYVAQRLMDVLDQAGPNGELSFVDWDGKTVPW